MPSDNNLKHFKRSQIKAACYWKQCDTMWIIWAALHCVLNIQNWLRSCSFFGLVLTTPLLIPKLFLGSNWEQAMSSERSILLIKVPDRIPAKKQATSRVSLGACGSRAPDYILSKQLMFRSHLLQCGMPENSKRINRACMSHTVERCESCNGKAKRREKEKSYFSIFLIYAFHFYFRFNLPSQRGSREEERWYFLFVFKRCAKWQGNIEHTGELGGFLIHGPGVQ